LVEAAAQTFYVEFQVSRKTGMGPLASLLTQESNTLYRGFVRRMQTGGLVAFFQKYPVLARQLATLTQLWTEAHVEFLQRLAADLPEIAQVFGEGDDLGPVTALRPALSDPHRGGRGVIALTFESGLHLVYKPKDLGTEAAYNQLLAWLNEQGAPLSMKALQVLNQTSHGWVEFTEYESCADEAAVARYHRRAGALLCLVYALEGTDCHGENLIASGESPVLIDNETLLSHRVRLEGLGDLHASAQFQAYEQLEHSVLRTGLLPSWQVSKDGQMAYDISGLGGYADQAIPYRRPTWSHVNTDRMALTFELGTLPSQPNIPRLDDAPVHLDEHVEAVVEGFVAMYRFLLAHREPLLAPDGPLEAFQGQLVRFVFRPTRVYALILKQLRQPRYLRDGADCSIPLEMLARAYLLAEKKPFYWPLLRAERSAMQQWDIPVFTARVDDDALVLEGEHGEIARYFTGPSFDLTVERLKNLDEAGLAQQARLIQVALHARIADEGSKVLPVMDRKELQDATPLEPEALVARAVALAEGLDMRAIRGADGSATWIAPIYLSQVERFQLGSLDFNLYDGLVGIALFLAALASVEASIGIPTDGYRELCLAALQPVRRELQKAEPDDRMFQWLGIGGAAGLGSVLYALVRVAQLLDEPALLEEAATAARLLTPDHIADDEVLDVIGGAAGAILGLLTVYEASQDVIALERAVDCGRHLLATRTTSAAGPRAWATIEKRLLTGFAHGAAGIAYALLRLASRVATGEADFRAAAQEAIAYEGSVFVEPEGNWPDLRPPRDGAEPDTDGQKFSFAWCHGAPGIGLARLGGLSVLDTPAIRQDVEVALATTQRVLAYQQHDADHVCCGNMGRIEVLLTAGERLARPELVAEARRQASQVVVRAERSEGYRFSNMLPRGVHSPGFFQGAAGIGYELLRLAYPDRLPSVLLWE
jgi:type 2 lantibiotic biosynthesis protein LanM